MFARACERERDVSVFMYVCFSCGKSIYLFDVESEVMTCFKIIPKVFYYVSGTDIVNI